MKIMITGGAGFIGSHLADYYVQDGHEVIIIDNLSTGKVENMNKKARFIRLDLSDPHLSDLIASEKPDIINHHAAQVNVRISNQNPMLDFQVNLHNTIQILAAAGQAKIKKFIFASSGGAVYGESCAPLSESSPIDPISPYGLNKWTAERYIRFFSDLYGFDYAILRYSNVYGLRQSARGEAGVISIFADRMRQGLQPIIFGNGEQTRDFVHVSDVVKANSLMSSLNVTHRGVFNVGTAKGTTIKELLVLMGRFFPLELHPVFAEAKAGDLQWNVLSVSKLKGLGWNPDVSLEEGLKEICAK